MGPSEPVHITGAPPCRRPAALPRRQSSAAASTARPRPRWPGLRAEANSNGRA